MKRAFLRGLKLAISNLAILPGLSYMFAADAIATRSITCYEKPAIQVFGTETGTPLQTGFVFKEGAYVEAPYIVSRRGADIYVNEVKVATPIRWPPVDYDDKKPEMPTGLTKSSTFKDLECRDDVSDSLDRKMARWLSRHYDDRKAKKMMVQYYRGLPFIADVEINGDFLIVTMHNSKEKLLICIGGEKYIPPTPEKLLQELVRVRKQWEERLKKGDCYFVFGCGAELSLDARNAAMDLPAIVRILRSREPKGQKIKELHKLTLLPADFPKKWESLVTEFTASAQLDERIKRLRLPPGEKKEGGATVEEERASAEKMMKEKAAKENESQK